MALELTRESNITLQKAQEELKVGLASSLYSLPRVRELMFDSLPAFGAVSWPYGPQRLCHPTTHRRESNKDGEEGRQKAIEIVHYCV